MQARLIPLFVVVAATSFSAVVHGEDRTPNEVVLAAARAIPDGGGYNWTGGNTGVPEEIKFKGTKILSKGNGGTYCCGITFTVVMKSADELKMLDGLSPADVKLLQKRFYGVPKDAQERQCVMALEESGLGAEVTPDQAKAGDFMQFYREKGGHSVIFLNWVEENGQRIGFTYRSSQQSTDGVGDKTEYFSEVAGKEGKVNRQRIYFGRLGLKRPASDVSGPRLGSTGIQILGGMPSRRTVTAAFPGKPLMAACRHGVSAPTVIAWRPGKRP